MRLINTQGTDREIPSKITSALGLTNGNQNWPDRMIAIESNGGGRNESVHAFAFSRGNDRDFMISLNTPNAIYVYRTHRDGKLIAALVYDLETGRISLRGPTRAQVDLDAELTFWATSTDGLISGK